MCEVNTAHTPCMEDARTTIRGMACQPQKHILSSDCDPSRHTVLGGVSGVIHVISTLSIYIYIMNQLHYFALVFFTLLLLYLHTYISIGQFCT